jgi:FKBP-type peptidyl-prolyl cis-trans isomerase
MKNPSYYLALLLAVLTLSACEQQQATNETADGATSESEVVLDTTEERLSYGIAFGLGQRLKSDGVPLDVAAFSVGLADAFADAEARLSEEEIGRELQAFQQQQTNQRQQEVEAIAGSNQAEGEKFLTDNATMDGVIVLESGLQYKILSAGDGAIPGPDDTVEVHYRGTLIDGTEFDSSYARGETVSFGVGQVIPGWTEALQIMPVGSKWQLFIPSELAYGAGGAGASIGPNATLLFDVELISIKP